MNNALTNQCITRFKAPFIFIIVGGGAFLTHLLVVFLLVHFLSIAPLIANIFGFLVSFNVSFWGHHRLTFAGHGACPKRAMRRLFILAGINFFLNESFYYVLLHIFHLQYLIALIINLTVLAFITYFIAKRWVFKN